MTKTILCVSKKLLLYIYINIYIYNSKIIRTHFGLLSFVTIVTIVTLVVLTCMQKSLSVSLRKNGRNENNRRKSGKH